jgi:DNA polymerase-3 subunit gamma/tau
MSDKSAQDPSLPEGNEAADYVVVARRYRPQTFVDLVGQQHVSEALEAAIQTGRVGHAYLFTGARGVGKTSAARILAKALDCVEGPTITPCNQCDICLGVNSGEDVDVLEIDGASNRGIDEIRQLRSNVNIRPSRARLKIYIIDEVQQLTRDAFNALLKTLEEPPEHVKFIFCTTEPSKIPITVLSRCQRFDFAGIETVAIRARLAQIAEAEGTEITDDALELLARRAAGSMRDGQSLLEQLLALTETPIHTDAVHRMLGTAESTRLLELASHVANADPASVLGTLDSAVDEGVDEGQLIDQLMGIFRDCMVALSGCEKEAFQHATTAEEAKTIQNIGDRMGLETVLAVLGVLQRTQADMRYSTAQRTLTELALVRCCRLEGMEQISTLLSRLDAVEGLPVKDTKDTKKKLSLPPAEGKTTAKPVSSKSSVSEKPTARKQEPPPEATPKKKLPSSRTLSTTDTADVATQPQPTHASSKDPIPLTERSAAEVWEQARSQLSGIVLANAGEFHSLEVTAAGQLRILFIEKYYICKSVCERPEHARKIAEAVSAAAGQPIRVEFDLLQEEIDESPAVPRAAQRQESRIAVAANPLVQRAQQLFGARPTAIEQRNR